MNSVTFLISSICCVFSFGVAWILRKRIAAAPTHLAAKTEVVTDLDAILGRTVGVRFHGRVYRIPPLSFEEFLIATNALAELEKLGKERIVSIEQVRQAYVGLFQICCPEIVKDKNFSELTNQQFAALYKTIFEQLMGKPELDAQKKSQESRERMEHPSAS